MFFKKKDRCPHCTHAIEKAHSFCPTCGAQVKSPQEEAQEFGFLGRTDRLPPQSLQAEPKVANNLGFMDKMATKMMDSMIKAIVKNIESEVAQMGNAEIREMPNGFQIKMGGAPVQQKRKQPTLAKVNAEQLERMAQLPRAEAKSQMKRFADKVVYELAMPGVKDVKDVFVNKLETGYEIKAIGSKKVYTSSIPLNLPIKSYSIGEKGLTVEFLAK
ncbi:zinc ribbon domain-containing protein [Candidatus Pacearchaeota archaeon]|nr:zinc ribbon domain-containing protein [Candidatus Pacearchaeota archaeon]